MTLHLTQLVKQRTIEREFNGVLSINKVHFKNGNLADKQLDICFFSKNPSQTKEGMESLKNPITNIADFQFSSLFEPFTINEKVFIVKENIKYYEVPKDCFKIIFSIINDEDFEIEIEFDIV